MGAGARPDAARAAALVVILPTLASVLGGLMLAGVIAVHGF